MSFSARPTPDERRLMHLHSVHRRQWPHPRVSVGLFTFACGAQRARGGNVGSGWLWLTRRAGR